MAKPPIDCGIYTFYGKLQEGRDGFLYLSSNIESTSPFEIRVVGVPRNQIKSAYVGVSFYNPKKIETRISNNSVVFVSWKTGKSRDLNKSENENLDVEASYQWPKLKETELCDKAAIYFKKVAP